MSRNIAAREVAEPLMALEGVGRRFAMGGDGVDALSQVSLTINAGAFVAIMGPSGSGKSTLMNILGLLDRPTQGRYCLLGDDVSHLNADARAELRGQHLGFVFQGFHLLPRATAADNVVLPLLYQGVPAQERLARAHAVLARVGLADRAGHTPAQLSGGQQQRVAIARALINNPRVLFADEPTGNLDSRTSAQVMSVFAGLHSEGITLVMVTHERDIAQFAQRVLTVIDGHIVGDNSPGAVAAGPPL